MTKSDSGTKLSAERKRGLLILSMVLFFITLGMSQEYWSGKVTDAANKPIQNVHVRLINTQLGTVTNSNGHFGIYIPTGNSYPRFKFSCIGYVSREETLASDHQVIVMEEELRELNTVVVVARNYGLEIIKKAIANIPLNYPNQAERYTGFFREMVLWGEGEPFSPAYIGEAVLESIKDPYTRTQTTGIVKLVEGRSYKDESADSLVVNFISGPYEVFRNDIVAQREDPLRNINTYSFEIVDTTVFGKKDLFRIEFAKKGKPEGSLFILDSTFAIVKAEYYINEFSKLSIIDKGRKFQNYSVEYYQAGDGKWRLKRTDYHTQFFRHKQLFSMTREYVTTNVKIDDTLIPIEDRVSFSNIFYQTTGEYHPDFWNGYNIVKAEKDLEIFFKTVNLAQNRSEPSMVKKIISRFDLLYEANYAPFALSDFSLTFDNSMQINQNGTRKSLYSGGIAVSFLYSLKSRYFLGFRSVTNFTRHGIGSLDLVFSKEFHFTNGKKPLLITPGISLGQQRLRYKLGTLDALMPFNVNGKQFDSGSTSIFLESRAFRLEPQIRLSLWGSKRVQMAITIGYNLPIISRFGLFFIERGGFPLFQKGEYLRNGRQSLLINSQNKLLENMLTIYVGGKIRLHGH